jgi:glycosyltransferase involved in cell wall biosynthesis
MAADGPILLAVGTLKAVKRHDLLVRAFARMPRADATLCILGEGQERAGLETLIGSLGLQDRVLLAGYQADPAPWYAHADLFVLSSDHEGFGNVLVEALEHGLPVVSTNCPTGPHEILEDGKYGRLVPVGDVDALARAMDKALSANHDREQLKRRALDFSVEKAADAYLDLLLPDWRGHR